MPSKTPTCSSRTTDMAKKPESRLQARIRGALEKAFPFSVWHKNHGGLYSEAGREDLEGLEASLFFAFEVKNPGKMHELTDLQKETIRKHQDAGGYACAIVAPDQATAVVEAAKATAGRRRKGSAMRGWLRAVLRAADREDVDGWRRRLSPRARNRPTYWA